MRLPFQAAIDRPGQDAVALGQQLLGQRLVALLGGIVTVNGMRCSRRRIASSTLRIAGLWLPATISLNCGTNSKKSCRMNRAVILSPPVRVLSLLSAQRRPARSRSR